MTNPQITFLGYLVKADFSRPEPPLSKKELSELEKHDLITWYDGYQISYDGESVYYLLMHLL